MTEFAQLSDNPAPSDDEEPLDVLPVEDEESDEQDSSPIDAIEEKPQPAFFYAKRIIFALLVLWILFTGPLHRPVFIPLGSSMEPAFLGPHLDLICPECQHHFCVTVEAASISDIDQFHKTGCPECGCAEVPIHPSNLQPGKTVRLTDKTRKIRRGSVVIFHWPEEEPGAETGQSSRLTLPGIGKKKALAVKNAGLGIKRIAGLPGEKIEICRGEILANGKLVSIPDGNQPEEILLSNMKPSLKGNKIEWTRSRPVPFQSDEKRHNSGWRPHFTVFPIVNEPENPRFERISQQNFENVRDFSLHFRWKMDFASEQAPLTVAADSGETRWLVTLDPKGDSITVRQENSDQWNKPFSDIQPGDFSTISAKNSFSALFDPNKNQQNGKPQEIQVELRFFNRTAAVYLNGQPALSADETLDFNRWKQGTNQPISAPFTLFLPETASFKAGTEAEAVLTQWGISQVGIYRDLTYSEPQKGRIFTVPEGEYLLLGDNSAVSIDSRSWKKPTIPAGALCGVLRR